MPRREVFRRRRREPPNGGATDYLTLLCALHDLADSHASAEEWEALRPAFVRLCVASRHNREGVASTEAARMFDAFRASPRLLPGKPPARARADDLDA